MKYWVTRQRNEETDRTPDTASEAFRLPQSTCWEHGQPAAPPKASEASEGWNASWQCPHLSLSPPFFHVCCLGDKTDGSSFIALMAWLWCLAVDALVYSRGNKPRITPGALQSPSLHGISPEEEPIRPGFSQFCCALNTASVFKYYGAFLCSIYLMHAHAERLLQKLILFQRIYLDNDRICLDTSTFSWHYKPRTTSTK